MDSSNSTPYAVEPQKPPTLSTNQQMAHKNPPPAVQGLSDAAFHLVGRSKGRRRRTHLKKITNGAADGGGGAEMTDEKAEVEEKIVALQKIVPGGEALAVENLFEETAEYILALECQVKVLRFLAAIVEGSDKEKRKLGG